ncbi:ATP-binding protein [Sphingomonas sp. CJ99]
MIAPMTSLSTKMLPLSALGMPAAEAALGELVPDSIIVADRQGRVRYWSPGATALYGWTAEELATTLVDTLLQTRHPFGLPLIEAELLRDGRWEGEVFRRTRGGDELRVRIRRIVRQSADGGSELLEWGRDAETVSAGEIAAHRYTNLFHAMAASFWELDFSAVRKAIGALVADGETDIVGRLRSDTAFIARAIEQVRVVDANDKTVEIFRAPSRESLLAGPMAWAWPPQSCAVFAEALVAALERRDSFSIETVLRRMDGTDMDALFTVCWPNDHKAQGTVLVGVIDITDRKRAFAELEASEHRYRDLFRHVPVALVQLDTRPMFDRLEELSAAGITDLARHIEESPGFLDELIGLPHIGEANLEAQRLFGAPDVDALRGSISWAWRARPETIRRSLLARLRGEPRYSEETQVNRLDGSIIDVLYTITFSGQLTDRGINVVGFVDLSEQKRSDGELRKSERRYRDLFHHVPMALWQVDTSRLVKLLTELRCNGVVDLGHHLDQHPGFLRTCMDAVVVQEVNAATVELLGGDSAEAFVGRTVGEFWAFSPDTFRRSITARYAGAPDYSEETVLCDVRGNRVEVIYSISFLPALQELGFTLIGTVDVRDRKRAEARLREVQAEFSHAARVSTLGELTASIAHEVNQPLAAITAFGEASLRWLRRPDPDLEEIGLLAGDMVAEARRASDIIARIRGMALKRDPDPQPLSINRAIEDSLLIVRHEALDKGVDIRPSLAADLPQVLGDRVQVQQVLVNLLMNAVQSLAEGVGADRRVAITTQRADVGVMIMIEDNGPGIAPEHLDHLFSGFFTTKESGMGMGLPICRSIVQAHGGRIYAENGASGARFTVVLPLSEVLQGAPAG